MWKFLQKVAKDAYNLTDFISRHLETTAQLLKKCPDKWSVGLAFVVMERRVVVISKQVIAKSFTIPKIRDMGHLLTEKDPGKDGREFHPLPASVGVAGRLTYPHIQKVHAQNCKQIDCQI